MTGLTLSLLLPVAAFTPAGAVPAPATPVSAPSALLFVALSVPEGVRPTFYTGGPVARPLNARAAVGLRPGYVHRVKLSDPLDPSGRGFFPTLEVRGTLRGSATLRPQNHPVPVVFTADDLSRARAGALVTRVYYLENPNSAAPQDTPADAPVEFSANSEETAVVDARLRGRVVLVARLGERSFTDGELAASAIPGTVLMPGDAGLSAPAAPPTLPFHCFPVHDPLAGPRLDNEECFHDGGDEGARLGLGPDGKLGGLDPSDSAIEFRTGAGVKRVCPSNRVCICVPRFGAVRAEARPEGVDSPTRAFQSVSSKNPDVTRSNIPGREVTNFKAPAGFQAPTRLSATQTAEGVVKLQAAKTFAIETFSNAPRLATAQKRTNELRATPCEFMLTKWYEPKREHQIGDTVTFYLRYTNSTLDPISEVAVTDSLVGRLEYVPGSATSDREAVFTIVPNEAGSAILRWEIVGPVQAGQTGVVSFRARIR